ncbi:MAG: Catechol 1,2-dioxygenase 1, partial [uncultured Pseudonocardia sp.]
GVGHAAGHRGQHHRPGRAAVGHRARPAARRGHDRARAPPARLRPRGAAHRGRVDGRRAVAHPHRADQRRQARGVHPRLRRARTVDARRADEPPPRPGRHPGHRARPVPHRGLAGAGLRRGHVRRPARHPALPARHRPRPGREPRRRGRARRVAGRHRRCLRGPAGRGRGPAARRVHRPRGRLLLRPHHRPARLRDPDGRPGRRPRRAHGDQPLPARARARAARRARVRAADHPPVPGGLGVPRLRRGVRHQGRARRGVRAARARPDAGRRHVRGAVAGGPLRLRAAARGL